MRSKRMRGGSLMCFTKPGAWLPAQRSAALCGCSSTKRASLSNLCSELVLGSCRGGNPQSLCLPFISVHSKRPAASRSLLRFSPSGPPLSHGDREVPAGSRGTSAAAPGPGAPRATRPPRRSAPSAPRHKPESLPPSAPAPHLAPRSAPTRARK